MAYLLICRPQLSPEVIGVNVPLTLALAQLDVLALQPAQLFLHGLAVALSGTQLVTQFTHLQRQTRFGMAACMMQASTRAVNRCASVPVSLTKLTSRV